MKYWANQCHIQQFWGAASFLTSATRKTIVQLGSLEGVLQALPSGVQEQSPGRFLLICILSSSKHPSRGSTCYATSVWKVNCLFFDELIFTLLRFWGSEFGIRDWYTNFKIALDMALLMNMDLTLTYFTVQKYC